MPEVRTRWAVAGGAVSAGAALLRDVVPALFLDAELATMYLGVVLLAQLSYVLTVGESRLQNELRKPWIKRPKAITTALAVVGFLISASVWTFVSSSENEMGAEVGAIFIAILALSLPLRYACDFRLGRLTLRDAPGWSLATPALQNVVSGPIVVLVAFVGSDRWTNEILAAALSLGIVVGYIAQLFALKLAKPASPLPEFDFTKPGRSPVARLGVMLEVARFPEAYVYAALDPSLAVLALITRRIAGGLAYALVVPVGNLNYLDAIAGRSRGLPVRLIAFAAHALLAVVAVVAFLVDLISAKELAIATAVGTSTLYFVVTRAQSRIRLAENRLPFVRSGSIAIACIFALSLLGLAGSQTAFAVLVVLAACWVVGAVVTRP